MELFDPMGVSTTHIMRRKNYVPNVYRRAVGRGGSTALAR